jgi:CubicO group peptidase (beta-lactamase class C family)
VVRLLHRCAPETLADLLSTLARKHHVPGAQLAVRQGGELTSVAAGEPAYGRGGRVTRDTAFPLGSVTKYVTATTALVLAADGDLELDEPLEESLPDLPPPVAEVTLGQLLSHTGGLAAGPDSADVATSSTRRYVADHCRRHNVVVPPGTAFSYSNLGYVVVGHLIETITGMSWREAVESVVLRPLGIEPGFVPMPGAPAPSRPMAAGHSVNRAVGRVRPVAQSIAPAEAPTGALALSAADLAALATPHLGDGRPDLLPTGYAERMRTPVPGAAPFGLADGWGLGLALFRSADTTWVGHDGNAHGTACYLRIDPESGTAVALTSNANSGAELWPELLAGLAAEGVPVPAPAPVPPAAPAAAAPPDAAGTYRNGDMEYVVVAAGGELLLSVDGDDLTPLTCGPDLGFALRDPATGRQVLGGRFVRDPDTGRVAAVQLGGRLAARPDRHAERRRTA